MYKKLQWVGGPTCVVPCLAPVVPRIETLLTENGWMDAPTVKT